ncbi:hypothetical protein DEO72_LG7g1200 [Vigna unguiculata]|uniref:Uncharacterized protein n=1 Tax=Vigna unguiculata TaxID=3917 RepID=A0A4D6MGJ5_VIGUN|nr:hypothetical protein DEO72_LG7g1200 [Vigna unguiculata]
MVVSQRRRLFPTLHRPPPSLHILLHLSSSLSHGNFYIMKLKEGKLIVQRWRFGSWLDRIQSMIRIVFEEPEGGVIVVKLTHSDVSEEDEYGNVWFWNLSATDEVSIVRLNDLSDLEELDILAQASRSHLSESTRNPLWFWFALLLRRRAHVLSEKTSCSGEEVSPKREHAKTSLFHSSSSRLGERSSPEREDLSPGRGLLA